MGGRPSCPHPASILTKACSLPGHTTPLLNRVPCNPKYGRGSKNGRCEKHLGSLLASPYCPCVAGPPAPRSAFCSVEWCSHSPTNNRVYTSSMYTRVKAVRAPDRLGILCLTTCVGLGYGPHASSPRRFSRQHGITHFPLRVGIRSQASWHADLPAHRPTPLPRDNHRPVELPSCVSPPAHLLPDKIRKRPHPEGISRDHHHHRPQPGRPRTGTGISTRYPSTKPVASP